ncbi:hypothetical protein KSF73_16770 [Burkholderiaceae bacterium DAT-1]|nr:hypothetical protein [Burkholderiaceae bacterium DAT-1]
MSCFFNSVPKKWAFSGGFVEWVDRETVRYSGPKGEMLVWVDYEPGFFSRGRIIRGMTEGNGANKDYELKNEVKIKVVEYFETHGISCRIES